MNPTWSVQTGRLLLQPVWGGDLRALQALKADPRVFAVMLGGVRSPTEAAEELAADIVFWGRHGFGMWTVREREGETFVGLVGILERPDGRGMALRFALTPQGQGRGYASEAASGVLRFGHERAGLRRIVAVARETNFSSRTVLGAIGMRVCEAFDRDGQRMLVYESVRRQELWYARLNSEGGPIMADAKLARNLPQWQLDHANRYISSGGTEGHMYTIAPPGYPEMTVPSLLLTTTGRKSGEKFIFPLFYGETGNGFIVVASKGGAPQHPNWYMNLLANPEVEVQVGTKTIKAKARTTTGEERARLWQQALKFWPPYADYEKKTEREIPVVVLDPVG